MNFTLTSKQHICLPTIAGTAPMWSVISFRNYRDQEQGGSGERLK